MQFTDQRILMPAKYAILTKSQKSQLQAAEIKYLRSNTKLHT